MALSQQIRVRTPASLITEGASCRESYGHKMAVAIAVNA